MLSEKRKSPTVNPDGEIIDIASNALLIQKSIDLAWSKITPWWPLKNLIAVNPLQGFESLPFEEACAAGAIHFQRKSLPAQLLEINAQTIKWSQLLFDDGQAVIKMPAIKQGVFNNWLSMICHDHLVHGNKKNFTDFVKSLPDSPEDIIICCLKKLTIPQHKYAEFLTLLLTSLPGWAGYIKYQNEWTQGYLEHAASFSQAEYLALRLILACALWPAPEWNEMADEYSKKAVCDTLATISNNENKYRSVLLNELKLNLNIANVNETPDAQFVFCIDVRSEPIRRQLESMGKYQTFGYAGFFGIPALIDNQVTGECYASCPVLIKPRHKIEVIEEINQTVTYKNRLTSLTKPVKRAYQELKYTFTTPFVLAEALGSWVSVAMLMRFLMPFSLANSHIQKQYKVKVDETTSGNGIQFDDQCLYAESTLKMIGLTGNFSKFVILCGHGSKTENNAYGTALDCGACGGHDGAINAAILASIMNNPRVREWLKTRQIDIPDDTQFLAAIHNTTTDDIHIQAPRYLDDNQAFTNLKLAMSKAKELTNQERAKKLFTKSPKNTFASIIRRSVDWSQTRPEWGLARNAAFIVGPRHQTSSVNLDGRVFLHSYHWEIDLDNKLLTTILTAPMVVAQWINCQYLFSTLDPVAYGSGSKITQNVVGKIGVMQGNASDLMSGLPLQSVMKNNHDAFHEAMRLLTVVYAPKDKISQVVSANAILKKLFGNGWVKLACMDPVDGACYLLERNMEWSHYSALE